MPDGARSALIVAGDAYTDPGLRRLRAPAHDAEALAVVLRDPEIGGFEVRTLLNEPAHEINLAVEEFFAERRTDDLLLVHVSCHGVKDESGELYFAASNTQLRRLAATAVAAEFVNRRMGRSRARRVVVLLDCCYAGAFERGMTARAGSGVGIEQHFGGRGRAVITASSAMEYAFEGEELADSQEQQPSVFTSALVEGLATGDADRDQDGLVGLDELYDYVYDTVREATPNQTPGKWTFGVQGDLYIARRARPVTTPTPLPPELIQAADHPLASVRTAAVQELERLLLGDHAGLALAARQRLERLVEDDSRSVSAAATAALGGDAHPPTASMAARPAPIEVPAPRGEPPPEVPEVPDAAGEQAPVAAAAREVATERPKARRQPAREEVPAVPVVRQVPADGGDSPPATPGVRADRASQLAALLAIGGAVLALVGFFSGSQDDTPLNDKWVGAIWQVLGGAALLATGGAYLLNPRARRSIGAGLLLGAVPGLTVGVVAFIRDRALDYGGYDGGYYLLFVAELIGLLAAAVAGVALARAGEGRLRFQLPERPHPYFVASLGVVGAAALVFHSVELRRSGYPELMPEPLAMAVMTLIASVCAAVAAPARFAVSLLIGWTVSGAAFFLATYAWVTNKIQSGGSDISAAPILAFGAMLLGLAAVVVAALRESSQPEGARP